MRDQFKDHWRIECSTCGEQEDRFETHNEALQAAREHFKQHNLLDVQVYIQQVEYLLGY
jgi:hypothetical protein